MSNTVAGKFAGGNSPGPRQAVSLYAADGSRKYLNLTERRRLLTLSAGLDSEKRLFVSTLLWTGARVSEVLALTPASFQTERGVVAIVTLKRRCFCVREVPVPPSLMKALDARFNLQALQVDPEAAVGRLWAWHRVTAWRCIKAAMRDAHIVGRSACPRGLRHGFGVGTVQAGIPLTLVQRWLGHARLGSTAIYTDACGPEEQVIAARFWDQ
jgi:integrase/recombinase XerD